MKSNSVCNFISFKEFQKWKKHVENIKMAKCEAPGMKE